MNDRTFLRFRVKVSSEESRKISGANEEKGLVSPADLFTPAVFVTSAAARSARPSPQIAKALGRTFTPRQSPRASPRGGSPRSSADAPRD